MFSTKSIRITSYAVMAYILVAIGWWAVLLHREHDALYDAYEVLQEHNVSSSDPSINRVLSMSPAELSKTRQRKTIMVVSEALFIGLGLLIGLWVINNGYKNLVRAEKLKQNFLLSISHELKSPIASIKLAFESMLRLSKTDKSSQIIVNQGLKETDRLHELVKNVLIATRLETGYLPDVQQLDLEKQTQSLINEKLVQYKNAQVDLSISSSPLMEKIDKQAFDIVVNNLIENGIKYSDDPAQVEVRISKSDKELIIEVADQGKGIPEEEKSKIFDRFYRIGEERKRQSKGTGLGLFLVRELISKNNGSISIRDNNPTGSIFKVEWPLSY